MSTTTADTVTSYTHQTAPTQHTKQQGSAADAIQAEIDKHRLRIANAQQLMLDGELSAADLPRNLPNYYKSASLPIKQKLIGSICSGKLIYEKNDYRTIEFNDLIQGICRLGERFDGLEKGQASDFGSLSQEVTRIGLLYYTDFQ